VLFDPEVLMNAISTVLLALTLVSAVPAQESPSWLPQQIEVSLTHQLANRMKHFSLGPADDDQKLIDGARAMILAITSDLDARGEDGLEKLAPTFSGFELPQSGQRELDLMVRYNICNLALYMQLQDPAIKDDVNAKLTSVLGLTAVTMVIGYLRDPFVGAGNDAAQIEAHLTDPSLQPIFDRIQKESDLRSAVEKTCQPVITTLLAGPLDKVGNPQPAPAE
jgi:hypothetical protein